MSDEIKYVTLSSKIIPKDAGLSEYFVLYPNPIRKFTEDAYRTIRVAKDNLVLKELKKFGITHENFMENKDRIEVWPSGDFSKHFFVDGVYAFTLFDEFIFPDSFEDLEHYYVSFEIKVGVNKSMVGMRCR